VAVVILHVHKHEKRKKVTRKFINILITNLIN